MVVEFLTRCLRSPKRYWAVGALVLAGGIVAYSEPMSAQVPDKLPPPEPKTKVAPKFDLPAPKANVSPFSPDKIRLPLLGEKGPLGSTPKPTPEDLKELSTFVDSVVDPKNTLDVVEGRTRLILLKATPTQTQIADDSIAAFNLLGPKQITILGKKTGTSVLTLWFTDPADKGKEKILSFLVRVVPDPEAKERLEKVYAALEKEIARTFPDSMVRLSLVGEKLVVRGQAKDIAEATQILRIVRANAPGGGDQNDQLDAKKVPVNNINVNVNPGDPLNAAGTAGLADFQTSGGPNVINLLRIPGEQQVMLRVTVAEVSRSAARSIGLNFSLTNNAGTPIVSSNVGGALNQAGAGGNIFGQLVPGGINANLPVLLDNGQIALAINALRTLNYAKSLAEPNLVALNGNTASFHSGGQFPVPVLGGFGAGGQQGGLQGVQFVPFGVQLNFTPVITDRDRIRLNVSATVSTRDIASGTQIGGAAVAGLNTRNFSSVVEMREGQSIAVAGLIQNNLGADSSRIPFFGDIPFLGRFASSDRISSGEQELVILITPELVRPLEKGDLSKLPGSDIFEPDDCEFYLHGRIESHRDVNYRSPVMTDIHRMKAFKRCEEQYIFGPVGHTGDPHYPAP
jgi:pilus assembly protein CpaC